MSMLDMLGINREKKEERKEVVQEEKKGKVYKATMRRKRGLKLWRVYEGVLTEVTDKDYEMVSLELVGEGESKLRRKLITKPGEKYFQALNLNSATKKAIKYGWIKNDEPES